MKYLKRIGLSVLALAIVGLGGVFFVLRSSLPLLDGQRQVAGLSAVVSMQRDDFGVATIRGMNRVDVALALGFAHAQDRFFQMDLSRRMSAGELSGLFGALALEADKGKRIHRFRNLSGKIFSSIAAEDRQLLEAYAAGVNQGLAALGGRPFEYWLLGVEPRAWLPEDSMLVQYAMFLDLNDGSGESEAFRVALRKMYSAQVAAFLLPAGGPWDAPIQGEPAPAPALPEAAQLDLRNSSVSAPDRSEDLTVSMLESQVDEVVGSNNWAVAGWRSGTGRAMLANDMHLGIRVPNTWYRARLQVNDDIDVTGVTLPGVPAVVAGSNGRIAWGFTNSYGDWVDLVELEIDARDPSRYRVPEGWETFEHVQETIEVNGGDAQLLELRLTRWGPVVEFYGQDYALQWTAHHEEAANLELLKIEHASSVEQAMAIVNRAGTPAQNFVVADHNGNIGWTIMGKIPRRGDKADWDPIVGARGESGWQGWLEPEEYPRVVNPESGLIWTANSRVVSDRALAIVGDGGYALGARGKQIRDGLMAMEKPVIADMLDLQLDDRAIFLAPWQELLLGVLDAQAQAGHPDRVEFRKLVQDWIPRASIDSVGYRFVRAYRQLVQRQVFDSLIYEMHEAYPDLEVAVPWQFEASLWRLVSERPEHLLSPAYQSWEDFLLHAVDELIEDYRANYGNDFAARNWGERNTAAIRHPLSGAIPLVGSWLNMPEQPLAGDSNMPRVQSRSFGASERFAVSPHPELEGYFQMPGGQSGHPLSEFYSRGHELWVNGGAAAFQAGATRHELELLPAQN